MLITLTTLSLLTVASLRSDCHKDSGSHPPNRAACLLEIFVNEKSAKGGGMSPVTVGKVQSAMEQGNTTCAMKIKHVLPIQYKITNTNHCLNWHRKQGSTSCKSYSYICTLSSPSGSNHTHALQTMPTIRTNPLQYQMQAILGSGLKSECFETRLAQ